MFLYFSFAFSLLDYFYFPLSYPSQSFSNNGAHLTCVRINILNLESNRICGRRPETLQFGGMKAEK